MPDICMCINEECPIKDQCYRYRAIPNHWQSVAHFMPINGDCEYFIEIEKTDKISKISSNETND